MLNIPIQVNFVTCLQDVEFNSLAQENENLVTSSGQTLSGIDNFQISKAVAIYAGGGDFYTDSGVANAYVLSPLGARLSPPSYEDGMRVRFRTANANTGASTVDVNSSGIKAINSFDGITPLGAGRIPADRDITLAFDLANDAFRLISVGQATGNAVSYFDTFINGDLIGDFLTVTHSLGEQYVNFTVYNYTDTVVDVGAVATSSTVLTVDFTGLTPLSGTWKIKVIG